MSFFILHYLWLNSLMTCSTMLFMLYMEAIPQRVHYVNNLCVFACVLESNQEAEAAL